MWYRVGEYALKYKKCPRCGLNYILTDCDLCQVCKDELEGKRSIFDCEEVDGLLCPYCEKNYMGIDDLMCKQCQMKRNKNTQK